MGPPLVRRRRRGLGRSIVSRVSDYLELVRAPASLTVIGDALVGAASARGGVGGRSVALVGASVCLYSAGMALNDYADADLDARERPERPIPSGRVPRPHALAAGVVLTGTGVGAAFLGGRAPGLVSLALAGALWSYDLVFSSTPAGPAVMALCRGLDVMLGGAGRGWRRAVLPATAVAAHTAALTAVSRGEVTGTTAATGRAAVATSIAVAAAAVAAPGDRAAGLVGGARYLAAVLPGHRAVARHPGAIEARAATRGAILALVPLQIALAARTGSLPVVAVLLAVETAGRLLRRRRAKGDIT